MSAEQTVKRPAPGASAARAPAAARAASPPHPKLITDITVEHGPADLLGRFFLLADTALRERGVSVSFGSYEDLLRVNEKNRDTWGIMTSMYDHHCCPHGLAPERAFCLFGRDAQGEVVATHAARLYELGERSMQEVGDSMLLHHDEPSRTKQPKESIEVTAPAAKSIKGKLLINGAVWYHPAYRKRQLSMIIPRVARVYAYTRWQINRSMGLMMEGPTAGGVIDSLGYPHREWGLQINNAQNGSPRCCLAWMDAGELLADLRGFLAGFTTQVYVRVDHRRAQNQG
jgi:hypothetical protein